MTDLPVSAVSAIQNSGGRLFNLRGLGFLADNPDRPPDWRYRFARYILAAPGREVFLEMADEVVREVAHLYREWEQLREAPELGALSDEDKDNLILFRLYPRYQHLLAALMIREQHKQDVEVDLQCGILARESEEVLAAYFSRPVEVIRYFKQLFFDVDNRIDYACYIVHYCIFEGTNSYNFLDYNSLCRFLSYFGGSEVFRMIRHKRGMRFTVEEGDFSPETIRQLRNTFSSTLALRLWAHANTPEETQIFQRIMTGIREALHRESQRGEGKSQLPDVFRELLEEFATEPPKIVDPSNELVQQEISKTKTILEAKNTN
ncbi:MAG: hypothetical protein KatS3mg087_0134 [Patescibacteria group bacterium]|nr:MAG: hypothetical protein KatS3mg087_0134 [Patescibacteria group bacterium]